jgi:hypothetical protein
MHARASDIHLLCERYESCMLLYYRRRGVLEITRVDLQNPSTPSPLAVPIDYTSMLPAANADALASTVSVELSSPISPPRVVSVSLDGQASSAVDAVPHCRSCVSQDDFEIRKVILLSFNASEPVCQAISR